MINAILKGLFKIITKFISIMLIPINLLITNMLPGFSDMLTGVSNAFNSVTQYFGWIIDATCLESNVISFFILVLSFRVLFPFAVSAIKLVVKWYRALMP